MPLINASIIDQNSEKAIEIIDNNYTLCSSTWDIEYVGNKLTFRNAARTVFASIKFDIENKVIQVRGTVRFDNGSSLKITDKGIYVKRNLLARGNWILHSDTAIKITEKPPIGSRYSTTGRVKRNTFSRVPNIAVYNAIECIDNKLVVASFVFCGQRGSLISSQANKKQVKSKPYIGVMLLHQATTAVRNPAGVANLLPEVTKNLAENRPLPYIEKTSLKLGLNTIQINLRAFYLP